MSYKKCPICGEVMTSFDHDDEDGNFVKWEFQCSCGYTEDEE